MTQKITLIIILSLISSMQFFAEPFDEDEVLSSQVNIRNRGIGRQMSLISEKKLYDIILDTLKPTQKFVYEYNEKGKLTKQSFYQYDWITSNEILTGYIMYNYNPEDSLTTEYMFYPDNTGMKSYKYKEYYYYHTPEDTSSTVYTFTNDNKLRSIDSTIFENSRIKLEIIERYDGSYNSKFKYLYDEERKMNVISEYYQSIFATDYSLSASYYGYYNDTGKYIFRKLLEPNGYDFKKHFYYDTSGLLFATIDTNYTSLPDTNYRHYFVSKFKYKFDEFGRITEQTWDKKSSDNWDYPGFIKHEKYTYQIITNLESDENKLKKEPPIYYFTNLNKVKYNLDESGFIEIQIFNFLGQELGIIDRGYREAGEYECELNKETLNLNIGIYFIVLKQNNQKYTSKFLITY